MDAQQKPILARISPVVDFTLVFLYCYFAAEIANFIAPLMEWPELPEFNLFTATPFIAGAGMALCPIILSVVGFYTRNNLQRPARAMNQLLLFVIIYLCAIAFYQSRQPRATFMNNTLMVIMVGVPIVLFVRYGIFRLLQLYTFLGQRYKNRILIIGDRNYWENFPIQWRQSYVCIDQEASSTTSLDKIQEIIAKQHPNVVMIVGDRNSYHLNHDIVSLCELQGIDVYYPDHSHYTPFTRCRVTTIYNRRMIVISSTPTESWSYMTKVLLDKLIAVFGLIVSLPLWIIVAIAIKLSDPKGPVFFAQSRSGRFGKPFQMWKFRSMYADAESRLDEIKKTHGNEMDGPIFKLTDDPRIFPFGHFIRKTSLDELPQLINVLIGHMSIVGPRPLPTYETADFPEIAHRRRLSVKPGITCYWQVEDRSSNPDFNRMIEQDLRYIDNWSIWLDIVLFLRTIPSVLLRRGAK